MAAVDVFEKEPLRDPGDPLLRCAMWSPPHISATSRATNTRCSSPIFSTRFSLCGGGADQRRQSGCDGEAAVAIAVIAGIDPAIHVFGKSFLRKMTWLPGSIPGHDEKARDQTKKDRPFRTGPFRSNIVQRRSEILVRRRGRLVDGVLGGFLGVADGLLALALDFLHRAFALQTCRNRRLRRRLAWPCRWPRWWRL